jgi:uncharacterized protein (DUF362 family)
MDRRKFIKTSGALLASAPLYSLCNTAGLNLKSRIVIARRQDLQDEYLSVDTQKVIQLLDDGMNNLFRTDNFREAWKKIVAPGEVIGLKINCLSGMGVTHREMVDAVIERLRESGIRANDIVIWDRFNTDLEECRYPINFGNNGIRYMGNDVLGFEDDFEIYGSAASLVCKTLTRLCDGIINLPVLKDHGIAGMTMSMKNFFGAIHNPHKYHLDVGNPYIPDVFSFPPIKSKVRLHICDAINPQYEGGPSYMPQWSWKYNGLILSTDPVAMDYTGWQIIEKKRLEHDMPTLKKTGREPVYIATAADKNHRLGTNDPARIEIIQT